MASPEKACVEREAQLEEKYGQRIAWPASSVTLRKRTTS